MWQQLSTHGATLRPMYRLEEALAEFASTAKFLRKGLNRNVAEKVFQW